MFTRQHYKAIAEIIKEADNGITDEIVITCRRIANELADYFADDNPRFDRQKFLTACEGG